MLGPGNVVIEHDRRADGPALQALAEEIAGPATPALRRAGQAVEVRYSRGAGGIVARSAQGRLVARSASDPALRAFVEHWLGRGAP